MTERRRFEEEVVEEDKEDGEDCCGGRFLLVVISRCWSWSGGFFGLMGVSVDVDVFHVSWSMAGVVNVCSGEVTVEE